MNNIPSQKTPVDLGRMMSCIEQLHVFIKSESLDDKICDATKSTLAHAIMLGSSDKTLHPDHAFGESIADYLASSYHETFAHKKFDKKSKADVSTFIHHCLCFPGKTNWSEKSPYSEFIEQWASHAKDKYGIKSTVQVLATAN